MLSLFKNVDALIPATLDSTPVLMPKRGSTRFFIPVAVCPGLGQLVLFYFYVAFGEVKLGGRGK